MSKKSLSNEKKKGKSGRPALEISERDREQVFALAGYGMSDDDIATVIKVSEASLKNRFREELDKGRATAKAKLQQTAYDMAVKSKNPAMLMFLLKTRCRWREVIVNEHTGKDGAALEGAKVEIKFPLEKAQEVYNELVKKGKS